MLTDWKIMRFTEFERIFFDEWGSFAEDPIYKQATFLFICNNFYSQSMHEMQIFRDLLEGFSLINAKACCIESNMKYEYPTNSKLNNIT